MSSPNADILDFAKIAFFKPFVPYSPDEIAVTNQTQTNPYDRLSSGSYRESSVFDTTQGCTVMAYEAIALSEDQTPGHYLGLVWRDESETGCIIDMDDGRISDASTKEEITDIDVWKTRILGALAAFADKSIDET